MISFSEETFRHIVTRLLDNARNATEEYKANKEDGFFSGLNQGTYEMMDILRNELEIAEVDLSAVGLDIDLEKELL